MAKASALVCRGHSRPVPSLAFSPIQNDGSYYLISSCKDGKPMLREGATGDWIGTLVGHSGAVFAARLNTPATRAITGSADFTAKVWNAIDGTELANLPHDHVCRAVDLSYDARTAVTGGNEKAIRLWDVETQQASRVSAPELGKETAHNSTIRAIFLDEQRHAIVSADETQIKWWDRRSNSCTHVVDLPDPIASVERTYDNSLLAIATGKQVVFLDAESHVPALKFTLPYAVSSVSLQPQTRDRFVTGAINDGWIRVHNVTDGAEVDLLKGHHGPVHSIAYSPDAELFASASEDGTIRLHQTSNKTFGLWAAP